MMSEEKKRRVKLGALFGAISGAALFAVLYFLSGPNLAFALFIPAAAAMGAGQMYLSGNE